MKEKPKLGAPFAFHHSHPGSLHGEMKEGQVSILRFDGDYIIVESTSRLEDKYSGR